MLSHLCRNSGKTVFGLSYLHNGNPHVWKNSPYVWMGTLLLTSLRYGRNTAEHTTCLGTTGPQVTLEIKCPQTEMPHPDDACISVMTTEKWRHNEVRGPLAGLPERSHHTLWCTCTAVSESPGHFLISWFAVDPHRAKTGRVERQSLWEGVPWQIYQWSAGLLISPSLPKPH